MCYEGSVPSEPCIYHPNEPSGKCKQCDWNTQYYPGKTPTYLANVDEIVCIPHRISCDIGHEWGKGTSTTDATCTQCEVDEYCTGEKGEKCQVCSVCPILVDEYYGDMVNLLRTECTLSHNTGNLMIFWPSF